MASDAWSELRERAMACRACPLWAEATQAVLGEGPATATTLLVGEAPGDQEDRQGRPFVGPAGQLLDRALAEAGIERSAIYLTNAVKHFKFEPRGKRRIHQKPTYKEVVACRPWLLGEIELGLETEQRFVDVELTVPFSRHDLVERFHTSGRVEETSYDERGTILTGKLPEALLGSFAPYLTLTGTVPEAPPMTDRNAVA